MKKCAQILALTLCLTSMVCACSKQEETTKKKKKPTTEVTTEATTEATTEETTEATTEPTTEETTEETSQETMRGDTEGYTPDMYFTLLDRDGNVIDESVFAEHKLTMINMWEPWCGPCVGEMPELEKLYEDYKDQGLLIIGIYSSTEMEEEVQQVLDDAGTTYPICAYDSAFDPYQSGYVPTTIFVDEHGQVYTMADDLPYVVGGNSYEAWATYVERFLA